MVAVAVGVVVGVAVAVGVVVVVAVAVGVGVGVGVAVVVVVVVAVGMTTDSKKTRLRLTDEELILQQIGALVDELLAARKKLAIATEALDSCCEMWGNQDAYIEIAQSALKAMREVDNNNKEEK